MERTGFISGNELKALVEEVRGSQKKLEEVRGSQKKLEEVRGSQKNVRGNGSKQNCRMQIKINQKVEGRRRIVLEEIDKC